MHVGLAEIGILTQYLSSSHTVNLRRPAAINTIVARYQAIDRCLLKLVLSTDGGPSSGVSQSQCKSLYVTESHTSVNTSKRREHNLIYAAVHQTLEFN